MRSAGLPAIVAAAHEPPATPRPETPTEPQVFVDETGVATFANDRLDECVQVRAIYESKTFPEHWRPARSVREMFASDDKVVPTKRPCEQQFAGMTALATCNVIWTRDDMQKLAQKHAAKVKKSSKQDGASSEKRVDDSFVRLEYDSRYYSYATVFEDHTYMKQCLEMGGDWQAVAEDSPEYNRARLEAGAGRAMRLAKRYGAL